MKVRSLARSLTLSPPTQLPCRTATIIYPTHHPPTHLALQGRRRRARLVPLALGVAALPLHHLQPRGDLLPLLGGLGSLLLRVFMHV